MLNRVRCVVLNATYEPLSVISAKRALKLYHKGKVSISEKLENQFIETSTKKYPIPTQVILKEYVKARSSLHAPAKLTKRNLCVRDKWTCQYCGRKKKELRSGEYLTRDHLIPQSRGGPNVWSNVVACCNTCNNRKANYTLKEAKKLFNMELRTKPTTPTVFDIWLSSADVKIPKFLKKK